MTRTRSRLLILAAAGTALAVVLVSLALRLRSGGEPDIKRPGEAEDKPLERARNLRARAADADAARSALQQVNAHLARNPEARPPALPPARRDELRRRLGLDPGELEELEARTFTLLDAHHLDLCFLLRDAA